jgi:hypothetical protein
MSKRDYKRKPVSELRATILELAWEIGQRSNDPLVLSQLASDIFRISSHHPKLKGIENSHERS